MIWRILYKFSIPVLMLWVGLSCPPAQGFEQFLNVNRFDKYFKAYTNRYFGSQFDWHYFKAQAIAESRLRPQARSTQGALGLMQILPSTFREIAKENEHIDGPITDPRCNIAAGIYYDKVLWEAWYAKRSFKDRLSFMFASYNAGKHTILRAQKVANQKGLNPYKWPSIAKTLPAINGHASRETLIYVNTIHEIKQRLGPTIVSQLRPVDMCFADVRHMRIPTCSPLRASIQGNNVRTPIRRIGVNSENTGYGIVFRQHYR